MLRRDFITLFGGAAATWPLSARAQQPMPVIGFLSGGSPDGYARMVAAFRQGLKEAGYAEGQNVAIEFRWAEGQNDRLASFIADFIQRKVNVIAATTTPAALAAKASATTIPVVFETGDDPVRLGLVPSLNRPGGNITGAAQSNIEVTPKRLQLLHELLPTASVIGMLVNPDNLILSEATTTSLQAAAPSLGLELHVLNAHTENDFDGVFTKLIEMRAGGLVIGGDPFFTSRIKQLGALTLRHAVPAIYQYREFPSDGGLLSYGADIADTYRLAGNYTGRVLKGDKPADLPVQLNAKVELVINLKTAKALGITVPNTLIGRADELIE